MKNSAVWHPYCQMKTTEAPLEVESAKGVVLTLKDGRKLIDAIASWWCVVHGYNNPELNSALVQQMNKVSHVMLGGLTHDPVKKLAEKLVAITPQELQHVFFADSGSVGVEVALKMALQYWSNQGLTQKKKILSLYGAYHGDTTACMSIGEPDDVMTSAFDGILAKQLFVKPPSGFNDLASAKTAIKELKNCLEKNGAGIAAFIVEPIMQGYGGFNMYHPYYLQEARSLCDAYNILLIFDEVATGLYRTGKRFAAEHAGVAPDIMILSKSLTAGYIGMSATLASTKIFECFYGEDLSRAFMHGPTFMGNPLACAVALKSLELFEKYDVANKVLEIEKVLKEDLLSIQHPSIVAKRVLGATGVIEVNSKIDYDGFAKFAAERGVWLRPFATYIYTMPAYSISIEELKKVTQVIQDWFSQK
jgi:adenosylmethionine-8-amino-7-oxononanoate aminotransferase